MSLFFLFATGVNAAHCRFQAGPFRNRSGFPDGHIGRVLRLHGETRFAQPGRLFLTRLSNGIELIAGTVAGCTRSLCLVECLFGNLSRFAVLLGHCLPRFVRAGASIRSPDFRKAGCADLKLLQRHLSTIDSVIRSSTAIKKGQAAA